MRPQLYSYQKNLVEQVIEHPRLGLFVGMGLGKTRVMLESIYKMYISGIVQRVLVVAPVRVCKITWAHEHEKWNYTNLQFMYCNNIGRIKNDKLKKPGIYTINPEQLKSREKLLFETPFDMLIVDESTCFKNPSSQRFQILKKYLHTFSRRYIMTGTPIPNGYLDLWAQIYILDMGTRLGTCMSKYKNEYFKYVSQKYTYYINKGADSIINDKIKDITLVLKSEQCSTSLPPFNSQVIKGEFSNTISKQYKKLKNDFVLTNPENTSIIASHAGVLVNKLLQFCGGAVYDEHGKYNDIHDEKLVMLREFLDNTGDNVLLAYNYIHEMERILRTFPEARVASDENLAAWNRGEIRLLIANPKSIGHGLNLQDGGSTIVWFSLTWDLEVYQQFNKRLHRGLQTRPVMCFHLCLGDIEDALLKRLSDKNVTQEGLLESLVQEVIGERIEDPNANSQVLETA